MNSLFYLKLGISLYLVILGFSTATNVNINEAFGTEFRGYGTGLIWMGMFSAVAVFPQRWGTQKHNRFALVTSFTIDTLVLCIQLSVGFQIMSYLTPLFPKDLQLDCLQNQPQIYDIDGACQAFFKSDRVSGMYLYWKYWYTRKADPLSFQKITILEGDNCCGFHPPFRCNHVNDTRPFPTNRDVLGVDTSLTSQRVSCGPYPGFYTPQSDCQDLFNIVQGIVGGCNYDLGLGYCIKNPVTPTSLGCASKVEDAMVATVSPIAYFTLGSVIFNLYAMLLACCMWWKRKANDVFPDINLAKGGINFADVRDQFEVKPEHRVLVKKGFLPETDKLRLAQIKYTQELELSMVKEQTTLHLSVKKGGDGEAEAKDEGPLPPEQEQPAPGPSP